MTKTLTVRNAEIATAAVEIKTLTVSGKQVTQAVFRQLVKKPLVSTDGQFNGLPWGTVNYHPDRCGDHGEHLHVVWQEGNELRRATERPPYNGVEQEIAVARDFILATCPSEPIPGAPDLVRVVPLSVVDAKGPLWRFAVGGLPIEVEFDPHYRYMPAEAHAALVARREELTAEMKAAVAAVVAGRAADNARWAEIQELPQLFIAV